MKMDKFMMMLTGMKCQNCKSDRILFISGKTSDCCWCEYKNFENDGYVPDDIGLEDKSGNYIQFHYCLKCGQIQGTFPVEPDLSENAGWQEKEK